MNNFWLGFEQCVQEDKEEKGIEGLRYLKCQENEIAYTPVFWTKVAADRPPGHVEA